MLEALGIPYVPVTPDVEELGEGGEPAEVVIENARRKARAGLEIARAELGLGGEEELVVLGVDTDVVLDGRLLGKAGDEEEARQRLEALSGRTHEVFGGVCLLGPHGVSDSTDIGGSTARSTERAGVARSLVTFIDLGEPLLSRYLASGEWRDRAGAYAIQGLGSALVERLEGDFANVVGLPLQLLIGLAPELFGGPPANRPETAENPGPKI
jgi:septum formation protein